MGTRRIFVQTSSRQQRQSIVEGPGRKKKRAKHFRVRSALVSSTNISIIGDTDMCVHMGDACDRLFPRGKSLVILTTSCFLQAGL